MHFGSVFSALKPKKGWKPCNVLQLGERQRRAQLWLVTSSNLLPHQIPSTLYSEMLCRRAIYEPSPWNSLSLRTSSLFVVFTWVISF